MIEEYQRHIAKLESKNTALLDALKGIAKEAESARRSLETEALRLTTIIALAEVEIRKARDDQPGGES